MNGPTRAASIPRRTVCRDKSWPSKDPNTTSEPASAGSRVQAQMPSATRPKAKPDKPWMKPPAAAPSATVAASDAVIRDRG